MASFSDWLQWRNGRQESGYQKMLILGMTWPLKFDCYLLKFPQGSEIATHTDTVKSGKHFRLNIVIKQAKEGGEFICTQPIFETKRIKYFRPDISTHGVSKIKDGKRYVLSLGWLRK